MGRLIVGISSSVSSVRPDGKYAQVRSQGPELDPRPGLLMVGNFLSASTGSRSVCEDLAIALRSAGRPVVAASDRPSRLARLLDFLWTVWWYRHRYHLAHVDVYSGYAFVWAELVCLALRLVGKPYVLTLHGGNLPVFGRDHERRVRHLLQSASAVTTPSRFLFEQMCPYRQDLVLLPNPLDLSKYTFKLRKNPAPLLLWLRAFHDIYNPSLAVRVVSLLAKDFPDVRLVMIGPDKDDGSLVATKDLAQRLGVTDRVTYAGQISKDEVSRWLHEGDIFLNTPRVDNTPVSVLEAMACGLCVVSTDVGGIPYLLEHEKDAVLVPTDDPQAMAHAVHRILSDKGLAERLSQSSRCKAEQVDWKEILPKWEELFTRIIRKGHCNG